MGGIGIVTEVDPPSEVETAITGIFTDVMGLFTGPIIAGVALVVAASVGVTWAVRKVRQNAR